MAKIQLGVGSLPRDCAILDISDGGVRMIAENLEVSAEFMLFLPEGNPRQCQLVWRIGREFGAKFVDRAGTFASRG